MLSKYLKVHSRPTAPPAVYKFLPPPPRLINSQYPHYPKSPVTGSKLLSVDHWMRSFFTPSRCFFCHFYMLGWQMWSSLIMKDFLHIIKAFCWPFYIIFMVVSESDDKDSNAPGSISDRWRVDVGYALDDSLILYRSAFQDTMLCITVEWQHRLLCKTPGANEIIIIGFPLTRGTESISFPLQSLVILYLQIAASIYSSALPDLRLGSCVAISSQGAQSSPCIWPVILQSLLFW